MRKAPCAHDPSRPSRLQVGESQTFAFLTAASVTITGKPYPHSLENTLAECRRLREENGRLRKLLAGHGIEIPGDFDATPEKQIIKRLTSAAFSAPGRMGGDCCLSLLEARFRMSEYQYYGFPGPSTVHSANASWQN